jgi:hypothetical protein
VAASLCGCRGYTSMAEWGRTYGAAISQALGFTRGQTPYAATFSLLFRRLDREALEGCLSGWVEQLVAALPEDAPPVLPGAAMDGKTLRGSRTCFAACLPSTCRASLAGDWSHGVQPVCGYPGGYEATSGKRLWNRGTQALVRRFAYNSLAPARRAR